MERTGLTQNGDRDVPFVTQHASRMEWLGVFAVYLFLDFSGLPFYLSDLPSTQFWQLGAILLEDWLTWVVLVVVYFHLFDRTPIARGVWFRNLLIRVVCVVALSLLQAQVIWTVGNWTAGLVRLPPEVLTPPYFQRSELNADALFFSAIAMGMHAWLRKVIQTRLAADRTARLEGQLSTARLHALSTELQPHFLFNTLNGIAALIPTEPAQAEAMLLNLSDLLRHTLHAGGPGGVPLHQELDRLDLYLDIQQMRLGDRLETRREVHPDVLKAKVPSLVLQPLVENAVRHGIERRPGPGWVAVRATRDNGRVVIEVEDNGSGLTAHGRIQEGIGLSNTRSRIEAMFSEGSLTLSPGQAGGAIARIEVPYEEVPTTAKSADDA